jgi:hypothetical protein
MTRSSRPGRPPAGLGRVVCRLAGHTGDWVSAASPCVRVRTCTRCGEVDTEQQHAWTPFAYRSAGRCEQERRCERCGATEHRVVHVWSPWRYAGPDQFLLKLHQVHTCRRCGTEEEGEFERAF